MRKGALPARSASFLLAALLCAGCNMGPAVEDGDYPAEELGTDGQKQKKEPGPKEPGKKKPEGEQDEEMSPSMPDTSGTPTGTNEPTKCVPNSWRDGNQDGKTIKAGPSVVEPYSDFFYEESFKNGGLVMPKCSPLLGDVTLPVIAVDFEDFEPTLHPADPANPKTIFPGYLATSKREFEGFLNGKSGPMGVFQEASTGLARLRMEVFWVYSARNGSYLKPRSGYLTQSASGDWTCDSEAILLDAIRDAVTFSGLQLDKYDADKNGVLDGLVLVIEGHTGPCSSPVTGPFPGATLNPAQGVATFLRATDLMAKSDPNHVFVADHPIYLSKYVRLYEKDRFEAEYPTQWAHELSHMLSGITDYYQRFSEDRIDLFPWSMTAGAYLSQPAAWEKAIFWRWIDLNRITKSTEVTIDANETPDGTPYQRNHKYIYQIVIDGDQRHYLTVENRWFATAGNRRSSWASSPGQESGIAIFEFDWRVSRWAETGRAQIQRHRPARAQSARDPQLVTYRVGEHFEQCYTSQCITLTPLDPPGAQVRVKIDIRKK